MKINPINQNQTSFNALYKPKNYKFSESQQKVIKDIEAKLGDRINEKDYSIVPYGGYSVALRQVEGIKTNPYDSNEWIFDKTKICAICDEENLLDITELDKAKDEKEYLKRFSTFSATRDLFFTLAIAGVLLSGILIKKSSTPALKHQNEIINKIDSLKNNITKDTLNLTKIITK